MKKDTTSNQQFPVKLLATNLIFFFENVLSKILIAY
jgi:hypothetical protein